MAPVLLLLPVTQSNISPSPLPVATVDSSPVPKEITPTSVAPAGVKSSPLPVPIATPQPAPPLQSPRIAQTGSIALWLQILRYCESGGNYQENTGNGFYGAYQFTIPTWNHWNTGYARADLAPASVQDATILENTRASGAGLVSQNPGCYAKGNLTAFPPSS